MLLPSGDHCGSRSITPGVWVRLRGSPFSAGTLMISPRAANTARSTVRRDRRRPEALPHVDETGAKFREIALDANRNGFRLTGLQIVQRNSAELLINDCIGSERPDFRSSPRFGIASCTAFVLVS